MKRFLFLVNCLLFGKSENRFLEIRFNIIILGKNGNRRTYGFKKTRKPAISHAANMMIEIDV